MTRLTRRRLLAIQEALIFRLAGEFDESDTECPPPEDYDKALDWVTARLAKASTNQSIASPNGE
jgi:hypothetical protein